VLSFPRIELFGSFSRCRGRLGWGEEAEGKDLVAVTLYRKGAEAMIA